MDHPLSLEGCKLLKAWYSINGSQLLHQRANGTYFMTGKDGYGNIYLYNVCDFEASEFLKDCAEIEEKEWD